MVVNVPLGNFSATDYAHGGQLIQAGYKAAEQNRAALLRYALDAEGWKAYLAARESRRSPQPGILRQVRVEGGRRAPIREVLADLKPIEGQPITPATTLDALKRIQSNGGYSATWETFARPHRPPVPRRSTLPAHHAPTTRASWSASAKIPSARPISSSARKWPRPPPTSPAWR